MFSKQIPETNHAGRIHGRLSLETSSIESTQRESIAFKTNTWQSSTISMIWQNKKYCHQLPGLFHKKVAMNR